jgi:hypothetical protein
MKLPTKVQSVWRNLPVKRQFLMKIKNINYPHVNICLHLFIIFISLKYTQCQCEFCYKEQQCNVLSPKSLKPWWDSNPRSYVPLSETMTTYNTPPPGSRLCIFTTQHWPQFSSDMFCNPKKMQVIASRSRKQSKLVSRDRLHFCFGLWCVACV